MEITNPLYESCIRFMKVGDYEKAWSCIEHLYEENKREWYKLVEAFRRAMKKMVEEGKRSEECYELMHRSYVMTGPDRFDDFMIACEWYRPPEEKYWLVRREKLIGVCDALQDFVDGELDELFLSLPPRVGKTTLIRFFLVWYMLRYPKKTNLYSSYTEKVVKVFYNGIMEILEDNVTYDWRSMFPKEKIAATDAKDLLVYINKKRAYANLTARSIDGTLTGATDADGLAIGDDLHSGIAEARSKDQLVKKWEIVRANFLSRKKGDGKILWIGTRWSLIDCISNRISMLENDPDCAFINYKVINVPALDENDESNFDYMFHKGFTSEEYKAIRASYEQSGDSALWLAPYMGQPIERDGAVFQPDDLRYYNGELPADIEPDKKIAVVDPAWGGGDYTAAIIVYQYGDDMYVPAVVFNKGDKSVTQPLLAGIIERLGVLTVYVEGTRVTSSYSEELDKLLREKGIRLNMQTSVKHWGSFGGKQQRIFDHSPEIRERYVFLNREKRDKEYEAFMQNLFSFVVEGKNKHDDAPDVLAMGIVYGGRAVQRVQVVSASRLDYF